MKFKKDKISNIFFSILLSLSMILGVNNFCYAEGEGDIAQTTASFPIVAKNEGLKTNDIVSFDINLKLTKDNDATFSEIALKNFAMYITYSDDILEYDSSDFSRTDLKTVIPNFDEPSSKLSWANITGTQTVSFGSESLGSEIFIGTLKFKLKADQQAGTKVNLTVVTEEVEEQQLTTVKDAKRNSAKLTASAPYSYSLQEKPACEHSNCVKTEAKPTTCTEDGNIAYWTCPDCGKIFSDETCQTEITNEADLVVKTTGHSIEKVEAKSATCTEDGNKEYYRCTRNDALFADAECTIPTTLADVTIPATGHTWDEGVVTQEPTYLADGVRTYTCQDCGETKTETIPKLTHDDPTAGVQYWGTREVHNGHEIYVDAEGKTSALVTGNEQIWLREESYDPAAGQNLAAWYMLDNTSGEFEAGSRFRVQWLNNKDNPIEFLKHFNNIDQTIKDRLDSNRLWIFLVGVTKPDGTTEYKTLSQEIPLYIQMGTDWDYSDIKAMYISDSADEEVYASYLNMEYPEGKGEFAKLGLKHFSPYAIYDYLTDEEKAEFDKLTDEEKAAVENKIEELAAKQEEQSATSAESKPETSSSSSGVKTGDETGYIVLMSSALFIIAGLYLELCMKKKRN